jgi:hypothetical protein
VHALDQIKQDGRINQEEFYRLYDPAVLAAASLRSVLKPKVHAMWAAMTKDAADGQIERLACWDQILADKELATIVGTTNAKKGTAMLRAMKEVKALDQIKQDGRISQEEFYRLYDPEVLAAAVEKISRPATLMQQPSASKVVDAEDDPSHSTYKIRHQPPLSLRATSIHVFECHPNFLMFYVILLAGCLLIDRS